MNIHILCLELLNNKQMKKSKKSTIFIYLFSLFCTPHICMSDRRYGDKQQTEEKERGYYFRLSKFQGGNSRLYYVADRDT